MACIVFIFILWGYESTCLCSVVGTSVQHLNVLAWFVWVLQLSSRWAPFKHLPCVIALLCLYSLSLGSGCAQSRKVGSLLCSERQLRKTIPNHRLGNALKVIIPFAYYNSNNDNHFLSISYSTEVCGVIHFYGRGQPCVSPNGISGREWIKGWLSVEIFLHVDHKLLSCLWSQSGHSTMCSVSVCVGWPNVSLQETQKPAWDSNKCCPVAPTEMLALIRVWTCSVLEVRPVWPTPSKVCTLGNIINILQHNWAKKGTEE